MSPIPKTKNVGATIRFLKREKPEMPQRQRVAIALETTRRAGAKIPLRHAIKKRIKEEK